MSDNTERNDNSEQHDRVEDPERASKTGPPATFTPGRVLLRAFYKEAVQPILAAHFPNLRHSAAIIGTGSEVLGFDDAMSTDHHWGPRAMLFLDPEDLAAHGEAISSTMAEKLPHAFRGYPTNHSSPDPNDGGVRHMQRKKHGPVNHRVELFTVSAFFHDYLGLEHLEERCELTAADWLTLSTQKLRTVAAAEIFHDDLGLEKITSRLEWYPRDVWIYVLASAWSRIGEEEHLMGRAGIVGDELGSALIASRLVRDIMRLAFLMERNYPPYPKWFGTAFRELACAVELAPEIEATMTATSWQTREAHLSKALEAIACMHNNLGLTEAMPVEASPFWGRPFRVLHGSTFAEALLEQIHAPEVRAIATRRPIGNLDLVSDNTDLLEDTSRRKALASLYQPPSPGANETGPQEG